MKPTSRWRRDPPRCSVGVTSDLEAPQHRLDIGFPSMMSSPFGLLGIHRSATDYPKKGTSVRVRQKETTNYHLLRRQGILRRYAVTSVSLTLGAIDAVYMATLTTRI